MANSEVVEDMVQTRLSGNFPDRAVKFCILMGPKMQVHHLSEPMVGTLITNIGHVTVLSQSIPTAAHKYFLYTTGS